MATPTASGKHPAGANVAATPPVSTPFSQQSHLAAFSPRGPRSVVPSPQAVKKSPANSQTLGSVPLYGIPSISGASFVGGLNFDSPNTAAVMSSLPPVPDHIMAASAAAVGLPVPGSVALQPKITVEDEKRRKLQQVIEILRANQGRVSDEGLERLTKRVGLDAFWENPHTLVIAGSGLAVDVYFGTTAEKSHMVERVSVQFPDSPGSVTRHAESAAEILLRDLRLREREGESTLTKMLDGFAVNLGRLAALDKLSVMPQPNCHEAVVGVYESLRRLYEWEVERWKGEEDVKGMSEEQIQRAVLCAKSGRPVMNARDSVGLCLDYWEERQPKPKRRKTSDSNGDREAEPKVWSLLVECASSAGLGYPPVRVSDKWISADIRKANPTVDEVLLEQGGPIYDWQEPPSILLPVSDTGKGDGAMEGIEHEMSSTKVPEVMFVAKFRPPLLVPWNVASQIYTSTAATMEQAILTSYDGYLFPPRPDEKVEIDGLRRVRKLESVLLVGGNGERTWKSHKNTLTFEKLEPARIITDLPFSHPRQLVNILPLLRQYAGLSSLIDGSFGAETEDITNDEADASPTGQETIQDEFEAFMADVDVPRALSDDNDGVTADDKLPVDVSLHVQPQPTLRLTFPFRRRTADISFAIGLNAQLTVAYENVLESDEHSADANTNGDGATVAGGGKGKGKKLERAQLARMLEVAGGVGVFVEFVRWRLE
jgi:hypothetical protein